ncbi:pupal cuticle protein Edg-78E-like [Episyrphus balteatus]|uniref:pupal cuticle protein Edg-78E-like n=1 Tax=Episyrphus balteatus TaxID=286459 RepID=UPI002486C510|nr:pupal cuticle protein Edg-78E-like [Episyrphus balteatus]
MFKFILVAALFGLAAAASSPLDEAHAEIKSLDSDISPEGVFRYAFQTSNGIDVASAGNADAIQGSYKYVSPEGVQIVMSYIADGEGFKPSGDGLPTPPPIPEAIIRSLEWNAAHPEPESKSVQYAKSG